MTLLHVICGLAPSPNQKSWLRMWRCRYRYRKSSTAISAAVPITVDSQQAANTSLKFVDSEGMLELNSSV